MITEFCLTPHFLLLLTELIITISQLLPISNPYSIAEWCPSTVLI